MPLISIILNTYNSARFVHETINSIQSQIFTDFEILVIDDGSNDDTLKIVSSIKDSRIKIFSYLNSGIAASRNKGIKQSRAEYIAFMDHDDLWHREKLSHQLQTLQGNPLAGFAYSYIKTIDESGKLLRTYPAISVAQNAYRKLLVKNFLHTASNPLMRREHVVRIGGFDEEIYGADDWDLFLRLAAQAPVVVSPHHEVYYRIVEGSGSARIDKIEQGCLRVIDKAFDAAPLNMKPLKSKSLGVVYQYLCFRTLEEAASKRSGLKSFHYLKRSYRYSPELWDVGSFSKTVFKALTVIILPRQIFKELLAKIRSLLLAA